MKSTALAVESENYDLELKSLDKTIYAQELIVDNNNKYLEAGEFLKSLKSLEDEICSAYDDAIVSAHKTHKMLLATKKKYLDPVLGAKKVVTDKCLEFRRKENEKRAEEQRVLQEKARQEAERIAAEAARENLGVGDNNLPVENTSVEPTEPTIISAPVLAQTDLPKIEGISFREDWDFTIEDASLVPNEYKIIDEKKIRGVVKALKGKCSIPGVRVFQREGLINGGV